MMEDIKLHVSYRDVGTLKPCEKNARTHSEKQIQQIKASIETFGFTNPIIIDDNNNVIAGNGRLCAAKLLGMKEVPTIRLEHLSEAEKRAYIVADNRLAELAGWDKDILAIELQFLIEQEELNFDIGVIGFETAEIDVIIGEANIMPPPPAEQLPSIDESKPAITQAGDLWVLCKHRLYCGDALEEESYKVVMSGELADLVFTDAPYNVKIDGHVGNSGAIQHREFAMASGEMDRLQFTAFLTTAHRHMAAHVKAGAILFSCMDWRHLSEILTAGEQAQLELKNLCVWVKDNGGMGSLYRSQHEMVLVFKKPGAAHVNNVQLGKHGRYRTNVWSYAGVNSFAGNQSDLALHPTVKPVAMVMDAIKDCSRHGDIVLDPFGGSGTTLIAAHKTRRQARLIELDPLYCDVIIRRWQALTGQDAVLAASGKTFSQIEQEGSDHE